jgi:hypothetical protein
MHTACRYDVRRAEKMRDRFEIVMNTEAARADFLALYNTFVRKKGDLPQLKLHRFNEYFPHADVFVLYFEDRPTCGRLVLRDTESRTALMLYSATRRLEQGVNTQTVGALNRYLHWYEMTTYQAAGLAKYDFGGLGANPSLSNFKKSFGGDVVWTGYALYTGAARTAWWLLHAAYIRWTGESKNQPKSTWGHIAWENRPS